MNSASGVSADRLVSLVDGFPKRRIVLLADLVLDEFVHGEIARVSREAPVLILRHSRTMRVPGGGGNAAANLRALDADPLVVGVVGRDESGNHLLDCLRDCGIRTSSIVNAAGYSTPTKSRILAGGVHTRRQQVVRLDRGIGTGALGRKSRG